MGYYIKLIECNTYIPEDKLLEAYDVMVKLNWRNDLKRGGSYPENTEYQDSDGPRPDKWFSWMDWNYHETCSDAQAILRQLGFDSWYDDSGNLHIFEYDSKTGNEDIFLEAIAHLIPDGCYMAWRGEEGEVWRYMFENGKINSQSGKIVWG